MITLNQIRETIIKNDQELDEMIAEYFIQKHLSKKKEEKEKSEKELDIYIKTVKKSIEELINENKLSQAKELLEQYKDIIKDDITIYSMDGIICMQEGNLEDAYEYFKHGLEIDKDNVDLLYNMAYINILTGNKEEAVKYYMECLNITNDEELIEEIKNTINQLNEMEKNTSDILTIITLGIAEDDVIFNKLRKQNNNIIQIIENNEIQYENKFIKDGINIYEINSNKYSEILEYTIRRHENCVIICGDIDKAQISLNQKDYAKVVYYTNSNIYTDKNDCINHNINIYFDKEMCDNCDLILTNDVMVFNYKTIIEKRNNTYYIDNSETEFDISNLIGETNIKYLMNSHDRLKEKIAETENEYEKSLYILAAGCENIEDYIEIAKYIYDKYKTEEMYQIYLSLLAENKDYLNLCALAINSEHCSDVIKVELMYLNAAKEYDLIEFIANLSIKNYKKVDEMSDQHLEYKIANYYFELNQFDRAYDKYINVLSQSTNLVNSPLLNRNVAYLMYAMGNDEYEIYYDAYKSLIECLYDNKECVHES
ncbi:tetratricopeptide repeat protein [Terrisporobacter glycolicus]|uniref:Tetratricopeptide repeat protein n=1 Tax=Terrisporobacter glycolicus ATCC 14880 = DSM 1288 TaxID=1121315 RepID=A0ABZ2ETJ1_9FIRM|nr:tetratricopeptide repeat protein [Terrisporobacter glycolicus]